MKKLRIILLAALLLLSLTLCLVACDSSDSGDSAIGGSVSGGAEDAPAGKPSGSGNSEGGSECTHTFGEWTVTKAPTCSEKGSQTRTCSSCSGVETAVLETVAHKYTSYTNNNDATCIKDATKTASCDFGCGTKDTVIIANSMLAHNFGTYAFDNNATCMADGTETATCQTQGCNAKDTKTKAGTRVDHELVLFSTTSVSCDTSASTVYKCRFEGCEESSINVTAPASGHSISNYRVESKTPVAGTTCKYSVKYVGVCSECGDSDAEVILEETYHTYVASITTTATCQANGEKTYTCKYGCTDDNARYTAPYSNPDAHTWTASGAPVVDSDAGTSSQAYACGCGETKTVVSITSTTHTVSASDLGTNELRFGNNVSLALDSTLADSLNGNIELGAAELGDTARQNAINSLTPEQQTALGNRPIYDFTLTSGGSGVDFGDGRITVTVPYQLAVGEDPDCIVVWYIADDGTVESQAATYHDGYATFEAEHFSMYTITSVAPEQACEDNGHNWAKSKEVDPTCEEAGYSVWVCSRCGEAETRKGAGATGHSYGEPSTTLDPTCTTDGKYVYGCTVCDHEQEIILPRGHEWYQSYDDCESGDCKTAPKIVYKCENCDAEKTEYEPIDPNNHQDERLYELAEGAQNCTDGVNMYYVCTVCGDKRLQYTDNNHIDLKYGEAELVNTIKVSDFMPDGYLDVGSEDDCISFYGATCICQKGFYRIELTMSCRDGSDTKYWWIDANDWPHEDDPEPDVQMIQSWGTMGQVTTYRIAVKRYIERDESCHESYYVDILFNCDENGEATEGTVTKTYLVSERTNHNNEYADSVRLVYENTSCRDGYIVTYKCSDCGEVSREFQSSTNRWEEHYYILGNRYVLNSKTSGHGATVCYSLCPCGSERYILDEDNSKCTFTQTTVTEDNVEIVTYTCKDNCGVTFTFTYTTTEEIMGHEKVKQTFKYKTYNPAWDEYRDGSGLVAEETHYYAHLNTERKIETTDIGYSCYVYAKKSTRCNDCGIYIYPYNDTEGEEFVHTLTESTSTDEFGNVTTTKTCANCDYELVMVKDTRGMLISQTETVDDPVEGTLTVTQCTYRNISGGNRIAKEKTEVYIGGELDSWSQAVYFYMIGAADGCKEIKYTVYSDGTTTAEISSACNRDNAEYVYVESTCTQSGYEGRKCLDCGQYIYHSDHYPQGHSYYEQWDGSTSYYECDRCGDIRDRCYQGHNYMMNWEENPEGGMGDVYFVCEGCGDITYDHPDYEPFMEYVVLERLDATDTDYVIGYWNREYGEKDELTAVDGAVSIYAETADGTQTALHVAYTDDGVSKLMISKTALSAALTEANLSGDYTVYLKVTTERDDSIATVALLSSN